MDSSRVPGSHVVSLRHQVFRARSDKEADKRTEDHQARVEGRTVCQTSSMPLDNGGDQGVSWNSSELKSFSAG